MPSATALRPSAPAPPPSASRTAALLAGPTALASTQERRQRPTGILPVLEDDESGEDADADDMSAPAGSYVAYQRLQPSPNKPSPLASDAEEQARQASLRRQQQADASKNIRSNKYQVFQWRQEEEKMSDDEVEEDSMDLDPRAVAPNSPGPLFCSPPPSVPGVQTVASTVVQAAPPATQSTAQPSNALSSVGNSSSAANSTPFSQGHSSMSAHSAPYYPHFSGGAQQGSSGLPQLQLPTHPAFPQANFARLGSSPYNIRRASETRERDRRLHRETRSRSPALGDDFIRDAPALQNLIGVGINLGASPRVTDNRAEAPQDDDEMDIGGEETTVLPDERLAEEPPPATPKGPAAPSSTHAPGATARDRRIRIISGSA